MSKVEKYAAAIVDAIEGLFDPESENHMESLSEIDGTEFFTAYIMAFSLTFNRFTSSDGDMIDSVNTANRLVFQYLMKNGKERD